MVRSAQLAWFVLHRIDDLESAANPLLQDVNVLHRIDDLEITHSIQ